MLNARRDQRDWKALARDLGKHKPRYLSCILFFFFFFFFFFF